MLIIVGCGLLVVWLLAVFMFKITKVFIHLVLIIAVVAIVMHLLRPR